CYDTVVAPSLQQSDQTHHLQPKTHRAEVYPKVNELLPISVVNPIVLERLSKDYGHTNLSSFRNIKMPSPGPQVYITKPGDTLEKIAQRLFGDAWYAKDIARYNAIIGRVKLVPEMELQ